MVTPYPRLLRATLVFIAIVQFVLGAAFLFAPQGAAHAMGLPPVPDWANWMFGEMAARAIGFGAGMLVAARRVAQAGPWIWSMIAVQALDWIVTLKYLLSGSIQLGQVSTAPYLPVVFIVLLLIAMPRSRQGGQAA